jgi:hypothetical protein
MYDGLHSLEERWWWGTKGQEEREGEGTRLKASKPALSTCLASENATHRIKCYVLSLVCHDTDHHKN